MRQMRGTTLLRVVGILYIIFSAFSMVWGLLAALGGGLLAIGSGLAGGGLLGGLVGGAVALAGVFAIVGQVFGLVAGILAVKWCAAPYQAGTLFVLGVVLVVFAALGILGSDASLWSKALSLALPVLYALGAYWNKQEA